MRRFAFRRRLPHTIVVGVVVALSFIGAAFEIWLPLVGVALAGLYVYDLRRTMATFADRARTLAGSIVARCGEGGDAKERARLATVLDRLAATFGVDAVRAQIVEDSTYNAALVPDRDGLTLVVTTAVMSDFELIELEGVVAHCLARERLGLVERQSLAAVCALGAEASRTLAGVDLAYRADEVAAASIRYTLGLAAALDRCAKQRPRADSFFSSPDFDRWRWVFFNQWSDQRGPGDGSLDNAAVRSRALEEW